MCSGSDYVTSQLFLKLRCEYECFVNDLLRKDNKPPTLNELFLFLILIFSLFVFSGRNFRKHYDSFVPTDDFLEEILESELKVFHNA
jgi:hypothetical protein